MSAACSILLAGVWEDGWDPAKKPSMREARDAEGGGGRQAVRVHWLNMSAMWELDVDACMYGTYDTEEADEYMYTK